MTDATVEWLLRSDEPSVRLLTRRDLLHETNLDFGEVLEGTWVRALFAGQRADGSFGSHPYSKWTGAHWRLVSLVELGIPAAEPRAMAAAEAVLNWLATDEHRSSVPRIEGLARAHASQEGNALAVCVRLGMAEDPRVQRMAASLLEWQWPDGGWNCATRASGRRSSFHESLAPMWGLFEYASATGSRPAHDAAFGAAELFLDHHLFRSLSTGEVIKREWLTLHYPPYWHYDVLQALLILSRMGLAGDTRCSDAIALLQQRRRADGCWQPGSYWWRPHANEVVDWGRSGPNQMLTLNALRVLNAAASA
jgi:hypothetical protein